MEVPLKIENEEYAGKTRQIRGSEGGRRGFTGASMQKFTWQIPLQPSARLTHGLKLVTVVWLLRCSVLRETSMASAIHFKTLNCYTGTMICSPAGFRTRVNEPVGQVDTHSPQQQQINAMSLELSDWSSGPNSSANREPKPEGVLSAFHCDSHLLQEGFGCSKSLFAKTFSDFLSAGGSN
jgi:hypothetical protein